jgi:cysteine-rich repeat protein
VCDDGKICTDDGCDAQVGCIFVGNNNACDDSNACTENDGCDQGSCLGQAFQCDDDNPCTDDTCDIAVGCVFENNQELCSDGDACTKDDVCGAGSCVGTAVGCDDQNPCTDDSCDAELGCVNAALIDGTPCDDQSVCTLGDACNEAVCGSTDLKNCDDSNTCTTDLCAAANGCEHPIIADCCGNGQKEGAEICDDGNQLDGDGCNAQCENESPCPNPAAYHLGYCWVQATDHQQNHSEACQSIGKSTTAKDVPMNWNEQVLVAVASQWGFGSAGDYNNSAPAMWCNHGSKLCGTHNWGNSFDNYGPYGDAAWWPVYTCNP